MSTSRNKGMQSSSSRRKQSSSTACRPRARTSHLEMAAENQLKVNRLPSYDKEFRFHPVRRWRFDFAWKDHKVALEVEGGIWKGGRHTNPKGFIADCEKYNAATVLGWKVLRVTSSQIKSGQMIDWVKALLPVR